jgi:lipocalin
MYLITFTNYKNMHLYIKGCLTYRFTFASIEVKNTTAMNWFLFIGYAVFFHMSLVMSQCIIPSFENLTVQSNFNLNKFLGGWYEIKWVPNVAENPADVWRNLYQSYQLNNSATQELLVTGNARTLNSSDCFSFGPWLIIANNSAKMILKTRDINANNSLNWPYYILKTDYDNYALIYACTSENYTNTDPCIDPILWLISRTTSLSNNYTTALDEYIETNLCINLTKFEITPQDGPLCYSSFNITSSSSIHFINFILFVFLILLYI